MTRTLIAKIEIGISIGIVILCAMHFSWCSWSLPRYGVMTSHGIETSACNWGSSLLSIALVLIASLTLASGMIGLRVHSRDGLWYTAQLPAIAAWGWLFAGFIHALAFND